MNNATYSSYVQHARHEAFAALGFHITGSQTLALASLSLTFLAPLRSRDAFEVEVWVQKMTAARLVLGQRIMRVLPRQASSDEKVRDRDNRLLSLDSGSGKSHHKVWVGMPVPLQEAEAGAAGSNAGIPVLEAEAVVVWLNSSYQPVRIPADVKLAFGEVAGRRPAAAAAES